VAPPGKVCWKTGEILTPKRAVKSMSHFVRSWKLRIQAPHQFHGIINRIAERVFSRGRRPVIQPRQSPNQEHSGHEIDQFLPAFVHRGDKISSSLYVRLEIFGYQAGLAEGVSSDAKCRHAGDVRPSSWRDQVNEIGVYFGRAPNTFLKRFPIWVHYLSTDPMKRLHVLPEHRYP
jgi:hypothetical protein